jgi:hypothetical protein
MKNAGIRIRNVVWITFGLSLVLINVIAEVGEYLTGIHIHMMLRTTFILGVTMGVSVLSATLILVYALSEERPKSGYVRDTLSADRKRETPAQEDAKRE